MKGVSSLDEFCLECVHVMRCEQRKTIEKENREAKEICKRRLKIE